MFDRLKRSFVAALALGWLFAWAILDFASIFSAPVTNWITRSEYRTMPGNAPAELLFRDALPHLVSSFVLFQIGYLLLRWLYFKPRTESTVPVPTPE